ncbi:glycolate oxidase subunit GlcF [Massilia dura]|uniref:Glycolate oxidase iron-sulfur subunit n=1 Tax=Pseudoduganella dura TaxID=321982 RepID=A0A6I3XHR7_9BURK|nr:glycolate oxidase subunit GlcF [Pseudoduganella dura]MUI11295.1 glycolate oxidase subunit GlcF [Pseudoduganella dura]GGY20202.1 glycolate oxidase iron-sulfur subunit [Pseudoduganella dura]
MQTNLAPQYRETPEGQEAEAILRQCVHCGFCTATCPTYQLLGDELDGPRGRIYLIKQVLEGATPGPSTQLHLDRCLTCRNCETTCPSGVQYGRLLDIGRHLVDRQVARPAAQRAARTLLREVLPRALVFKPLMRAGQWLRPALPAALRAKVARPAPAGEWPRSGHARKMLLLDGCVQPSMAPNINAATARVFDALGIELVIAPKAGCCGAIRYHLNDQAGGLDDMRRNIDAWWPLVEAGAEAIVMTASGCGATVKEYGHLLRHDAAYAGKAGRISALTKDVSEILCGFQDALVELINGRTGAGQEHKVAFHPPCTLQHGQQIRGKVEGLLRAVGIDVRLCADSHLCCGSAGTYSLLQPELSGQLRERKLAALHATGADEIVSANIGCQSHLQGGTAMPVGHWIELLDRLSSRSRGPSAASPGTTIPGA